MSEIADRDGPKAGSLGNLNAALYMPLDGSPSSENAIAFVLALAELVADKPTKPFRKAIGAFACDLVRNARFDPAQWSYRPMGASNFADTIVSYKTAQPLTAKLIELGLIEFMRGYSANERSFGARAARMRPTAAFLSLAREHGVEPKRWRDHFSRPKPDNVVVASPLILKGAKRRQGRAVIDAPILAISPTDQTATRLQDRMVAINRFMALQTIEPWGQVAFRRSFLLGDQPGFAWNKGGRIAAIGDSYQNARKIERQETTINGEPVVEIDVKASNLTLLYGLKGVPMDHEDPYAIEGLPRDVVKAWITMTLGHSRFHTRWPDDKKEELRPVIDGELQTLYPISQCLTRKITKHSNTLQFCG